MCRYHPGEPVFHDAMKVYYRLYAHVLKNLAVCVACVRACVCVYACVRACVKVCVVCVDHACLSVCVFAGLVMLQEKKYRLH